MRPASCVTLHFPLSDCPPVPHASAPQLLHAALAYFACHLQQQSTHGMFLTCFWPTPALQLATEQLESDSGRVMHPSLFPVLALLSRLRWVAR